MVGLQLCVVPTLKLKRAGTGPRRICREIFRRRIETPLENALCENPGLEGGGVAFGARASPARPTAAAAAAAVVGTTGSSRPRV